MTWRNTTLTLISLAVALAIITLVALEGQEVVVVRTYDADGRPHDTRTWIADEDGGAWIEAATPERPFLQHIARAGRVEIERGGAVRKYRASLAANPEGHARIRALLRSKYGWADWWIGLLQDTSASVAVRLVEERGTS